MKKYFLVCLILFWGCRYQSDISQPPIPPCEHRGSNIAKYLEGAERQSETDDQRKEILKALRDLLVLSPDEMLRQRYADYQLEPRKWTAVKLLHSYFVPTIPCMEGNRQTFYFLEHTEKLYKNATTPEAQEEIVKHIKKIKSTIEENGTQ